jgi:hypothetical protein
VVTIAAVPMTAHNSWRLKIRHGELPRCNEVIADAENTITSPNITRKVTTSAIT